MFTDFKGVRGICWKVKGGRLWGPRAKGTFDGSSDKAVKVVYIFGTEGQASLKVAKGVLKALKTSPNFEL